MEHKCPICVACGNDRVDFSRAGGVVLLIDFDSISECCCRLYVVFRLELVISFGFLSVNFVDDVAFRCFCGFHRSCLGSFFFLRLTICLRCDDHWLGDLLELWQRSIIYLGDIVDSRVLLDVLEHSL